MQRINSAKELQKAILELESVQKKQAGVLKDQFGLTAASLHPVNLFMSVLKEILSSPVVFLFGIDRIRKFGHRLIDLISGKKEPVSGND